MSDVLLWFLWSHLRFSSHYNLLQCFLGCGPLPSAFMLFLLSPLHSLTTAGSFHPCSLHAIKVWRTTLILPFFPLLSSVKLQKQSPRWLKLSEHLSFTTFILPLTQKHYCFNLLSCCSLTFQNHTENTFTCIVSLLWMCCRNIIFQVPYNLVIFNFYHCHTWKMPQHANNHKDYSSVVVIQWLSGGKWTASVPTLDHDYLKLTHN